MNFKKGTNMFDVEDKKMKFLGVLLSILVLFSGLALTANAEDSTADLNTATADEAKTFNAETYDYKTLINSMWDEDNQVEDVKFIGLIRDTELDCIALVHATGYPVTQGIEYTEIDGYLFASAGYNPTKLGLYVVHFTKRPHSMCIPEEEPIDWYVEYQAALEDAARYGTFNMYEVYNTIKKAQEEKGYLGFTVERKDGELGEKIAAAVEAKYETCDFQDIIGEISENKYLVYCANFMVSPAIYEEQFGLWLFTNNNYVHRYPLGLYVIDGDTAYSLKDAYDKEVISGDEFGKVVDLTIKSKYVSVGLVEPPEPEPSTTKPATTEPATTEPYTGMDLPTVPSQPIDPIQDVYNAVENTFGKHAHYEVLGDTKDYYLVRGINFWVGPMPYTETLGSSAKKYYIKSLNHYANYPLGLYIVKNNAAYTLKEAWDKKVISEKELENIVKIVDEKTNFEVTVDVVSYEDVDNTKKLPANPVKVTAKTKTVKVKKLLKKKQTVKFLTIKNAKGKVKVTKVKKGTSAKIYKKIKVNSKTGAVILAKGKYKNDTYKIKLKVNVKGTKKYAGKTITKTVKIKISKVKLGIKYL